MELVGSSDEVDGFLAAFEEGTLAKERFTHAAHVMTGACYVYQMGEAAATNHMRVCVRRFNEAVGGKNTATAGYHETVTVFWIALLAELLRRSPAATREEFAALAVERFGGRRDVLAQCYDFDVVGSVEARARWVAPRAGSVEDVVGG